MRYAFHTGEELLALCRSEHMPISRVALAYEEEAGERSREEILAEMEKNLATMEESIRVGLEDKQTSITGLMGDAADKLMNFREEALMGKNLAAITAASLAVVEVNASMGRIVAAPTAGASGVLPGVVIEYARQQGLPREKMIEALFNGGAIGILIAHNACISGASGGCQAEIGSASGMAAAAICSVRGGSKEQMGHACAMALKNLMGLVCDPVAGLVEVPCVKRNVGGAVNALAAADMALAGIASHIPVDQVIDAMGEVGMKMDVSLRETSMGGVATSPKGLEIAERLGM